MVFVPVRGTIEVDNGDVNDAVGASGEEVSEKEVAPFVGGSDGGVAGGFGRFGGLGEDSRFDLGKAGGCGFFVEGS